jgi:1-acyl-sn-glycerol-3-phosphate acyltransferase
MEPSQRRAIEQALRYARPWQLLTAPRLDDLEHVPDAGPMMLVGNHTLMGLYDATMLFLELFDRRGLLVRGLGDHGHFAIPLWRDLACFFGVVDGTPENCARLLADGETLLVFPGGAREVAKRKGEKYRLIWKDRVGFVRVAARAGCPLVPFAAVGAEEAWDIVLDADDLLAGPLGALADRFGFRRDAVFPILRGIGPTPLPRPQRLYFRFFPPVPTTGLDPDDRAACLAVRNEIRATIEAGIASLQQTRAHDPDRDVVPRLLRQAANLLPRRPPSDG